MGLLFLVILIVGAVLFLEIVGSLLGFIFMLIVAGLVGWVADAIVPGRMPYGWVGAIGAGLVGAWLGTMLIGIKPPIIAGVPIVPAILGAVILTFLMEVLMRTVGPRYHLT